MSCSLTETGLPLTEARNHFEAQANRDGLIEVSGQLRTLAYGLMKISNDIRWMGSGPNTGLGELHIPDLQPGSSIMPGKVNPVICEATIMVAAQVIGNDATIALSSTNGAFELNVGIPVMAANLLQSIRLLANVSRVSAEKMIDGLTANVDRCRFLAEASPSTVTPLNKLIGYEAAAKIAKYSVAHKVTVREAVVALGYVERGEVLRSSWMRLWTSPRCWATSNLTRLNLAEVCGLTIEGGATRHDGGSPLLLYVQV